MNVTDEQERQEEKRFLRGVLNEIIAGYSVIDTKDYDSLFLKHISNADSAQMDAEYNKLFNKYKSQLIPTNEEKIKLCIEEGEWSEERDVQARDLKYSISNEKKTLAKLGLERDREIFKERIRQHQEELDKIKLDKLLILGCTCESMANRRVNENYILNSLYKDEKLNAHAFERDDFDDLDTEELNNLVSHYEDSSRKFTDITLKKISLSPDFLHFFNISNDNPYTFYGQPVIRLTFYQAGLFHYGLYFKNTLTNLEVSPPEQLYEDPEALIDWIESSRNVQTTAGQKKEVQVKTVSGGGATSIVGASGKDMSKVSNAEVLNFSAAAKKKGGSLNMADIMAMH